MGTQQTSSPVVMIAMLIISGIAVLISFAAFVSARADEQQAQQALLEYEKKQRIRENEERFAQDQAEQEREQREQERRRREQDRLDKNKKDAEEREARDREREKQDQEERKAWEKRREEALEKQEQREQEERKKQLEKEKEEKERRQRESEEKAIKEYIPLHVPDGKFIGVERIYSPLPAVSGGIQGTVYRVRANRLRFPGFPAGLGNQRFSFECYFFVVDGGVEKHEISSKGYAVISDN